MGLRVIALGTGVCANGFLANDHRQPPGFLIDADGVLLLLDCSEGIRFRLEAAGYDYGDVGHVAITHGHPDHAMLPQFIQAKYGRRIWANDKPNFSECTIYAPTGLVKKFPAVWDWHQPENDGAYWPELSPTFIPMGKGSAETIAPGVVLKSFVVPHGFGRHPAVAFRVETPSGVVAYSGDTGMSDELVNAAMDADVFICEASFRIGYVDAQKYGHLTPRDAGEAAKLARVKQLRVTHYPGLDTDQAMLHEVREAGFVGDAAIAKDGDRYDVV